MSTTNMIAIGPVAHAATINAVLNGMGSGPESLFRMVTSVEPTAWMGPAGMRPRAPFGTAPTHRYMSHQVASLGYQAQLLAFANRDAPPLQPGFAWGEDTLPEIEAALDALETLAVASFGNNFVPQAQLDAALAAHNPPLWEVADEDI